MTLEEAKISSQYQEIYIPYEEYKNKFNRFYPPEVFQLEYNEKFKKIRLLIRNDILILYR